MKITQQVVREFAGIEIYNLKLSRIYNDYYILIELDNLLDPYGSVSIKTCEVFSKRFIEKLDEALLSQSKDNNVILPADLQVDNYTLEVSSAGAEREIKIPEDLERFKNLLIKIYVLEENKNQNKPVEKIVKYLEKKEDVIVFEEFNKKDKNKKAKTKLEKKYIQIKKDNIKKANLYLDI